MKNILLLFCIVTSIGCSKSDEKLIAGVWDVQQLLINGNDSTNAVKTQSCYVRMKFLTSKEQGDRVANILGGDPQDTGCDMHGIYQLEEDYVILQVGSPNFRPVGAFWYLPSNTKITWNILNLDKEHMVLETTFNGDQNRLTLSKED